MYLFILLVIEVILLFVVGAYIGAGNTFLLIILTFIAGIYFLIRSLKSAKGAMVDRTIQHDISGHIGYAVGAILLILPGFFTDTIGLMLVIPYTRGPFIRVLSEIALMFAPGFFVDIIVDRLRKHMNNNTNPNGNPNADPTQNPNPNTTPNPHTNSDDPVVNREQNPDRVVDAEYRDVE